MIGDFTRSDLATPAGTARTLRAFGLRPRKRLGQHFMVSRHALERMLDAADLSRADTVLEVGAGLGTLTAALAERAGHVLAVEVDPALLPPLRAAVAPYPNVTVVHADIMSLDLTRVLPPTGPKKVVANLPYNVASSLIVSLLEHRLGFERMVLTLQREVAARLAAPPGIKDYGVLSVAVQYRAVASVVATISASAFYPPPEVESAIVLLHIRPRPVIDLNDEALFFRVVRAAFAQRRKTLRNALAGALPLSPGQAEAACRRAGIEPRRRGETLTLQEFAALVDSVGSEIDRRKQTPIREEQ